MRHRRHPAEQRLGEAVERSLDPLRRRLLGRELGVHVGVAEAADDQPAFVVLVPVVVAVPAVVRHREQALGERLGRDHLPARRDDQALELARAGRSGSRPWRRGRSRPRARPGPRRGRARGSRHPPPQPRARAAARAVPAAGRRRPDGRARPGNGLREARQLVAPLGGEAVLAQRLVLRAELVPLVVAGEPEAAGAADRVAAELGHPVDVGLRQAPVVRSDVVAEPLACAVVCHRPAAEGKPAVAAARAGGDRARLVQPHALAQACERERSRDAGDPAADDRDVGRPRKRLRPQRRSGLGEPEGVGHAAMLAGSPVDTVLLPHGARELELGQRRPPARPRRALSRGRARRRRQRRARIDSSTAAAVAPTIDRRRRRDGDARSSRGRPGRRSAASRRAAGARSRRPRAPT